MNYNRLNSVMVRKEEDGLYSSYFQLTPNEKISIKEEDKVRSEIERWINAICFTGGSRIEELKKLSPALAELKRHKNYDVLMRTVRMLKFFEILFLSNDSEFGEDWSLLVEEAKGILNTSCPAGRPS